MVDRPHVFEDGTITITVNRDGFQLYVGTLEVKYVAHIGVRLDISNEPDISIQLSGDNSLAIDEMARIIKTVPWLKIT